MGGFGWTLEFLHPRVSTQEDLLQSKVWLGLKANLERQRDIVIPTWEIP